MPRTLATAAPARTKQTWRSRKRECNAARPGYHAYGHVAGRWQCG